MIRLLRFVLFAAAIASGLGLVLLFVGALRLLTMAPVL